MLDTFIELLSDWGFIYLQILIPSFIIVYFNRSKIARLIGLSFFTIILSYIAYFLFVTTDGLQAVGWSAKIWFLSIDLQILFYFFFSVVLVEHLGRTVEWQKKVLLWVIFPFIIFNQFLFFFTDIYFKLPQSREGMEFNNVLERIDFTGLQAIPIIFHLFLQTWAAINIIQLLFSWKGKDYRRRQILLLTIGFTVVTTKGIWDSLQLLTEFRLYSPLIEQILSLSYLVGTLFVLIAIINFNAFADQKKSLLKEAIFFLVYNTLVIAALNLCIYAAIGYRDEGLNILYLVVPFVGIILANHAQPLMQLVRDWIFKQNSTLDLINNKRVAFVLKNFNDRKTLKNSQLLGLESVNSEANFNSLNRIDALKSIFQKVLGKMRMNVLADIDKNNRTKSLIKYEMLRMIAEEDAKESQILWELGFQSSSNLPTDASPEYRVKKNSEYKATSVISYKRLRREAFADFTILLKEEEKQRLRI